MDTLIEYVKWFHLIHLDHTLRESIDREPRFKNEVKNNTKVKKLLELSLKLEDLIEIWQLTLLE